MMVARYHLHISPDAIVLAMGEDGDADIVAYAEAHGVEAACLLFEDWLLERIAERRRATETAKRRKGFRVVGEGRA